MIEAKRKNRSIEAPGPSLAPHCINVSSLRFVMRGNHEPANSAWAEGASNKGVLEMCDFSLQAVRSRPAKVGDKLVTRDFGAGTRGFAAADDPGLAVCVMPGTELAFAGEVACLSTGLTRVEDKDDQPPDGHLSTSQQGEVGRPSRCARISRWAYRVIDVPVRGSGGNRASASSAASDRGRGASPEARHLRRLTVEDGPE